MIEFKNVSKIYKPKKGTSTIASKYDNTPGLEAELDL